jgi:dTDP-4-dehydrorhamnose 3,5-epimerase
MNFVETTLKGAYLVHPKRIADDRGFFARAWCRDEFASHGLNPNMVQLNVAASPRKGTLRGLHHQHAPHAEAKFVRCTQGAIFDVIVDLRADSPTRGQWFGTELTAGNGIMLYAPEGFAHGYQTLSDDTEMYYLTSAPYSATAAGGVRYNDEGFGIEWPLPVAVISEADRSWPDYRLS